MLDHFHHGQGSVFSLLEYKLTLDSDLPSLRIKLLPKLPFTDLPNALPTIMVFCSALLLIKKLTIQQKKCGGAPPYKFLTPWKQLS